MRTYGLHKQYLGLKIRQDRRDRGSDHSDYSNSHLIAQAIQRVTAPKKG